MPRDGEAELSSSSISSPPASPRNADTIRVAHLPNPLHSGFGEGVANAVAATPAQPALATNSAAYATNLHTSSASSTTAHATPNGAAPEKPKRQRKKKEVQLGPDGKPIVEDKPKKPRKPREPKDKAAPGTTSTTTAAPRKKLKTEPKAEEKAPSDATAQARQPTITEMVSGFHQPAVPTSSTPVPSQPQHHNTDGLIRNSLPPSFPSAPPSRPISSGQNYDPIRGSTMDVRPSYATNGAQAAASAVHVNRASASPAIASLIDPPSVPLSHSQQTSTPVQTSAPPQQISTPPRPEFVPLAVPPPQAATTILSNIDGAMDVDPATVDVPNRQIPEIQAPSKSSSSAPTPKAARPTPEPPKGTGSGLLSTSDLFGGPSASEPSERRGVNIDLQIPLNPKGGNTINIAQEIIKKYGREAINPRAAAHREQLLRLAEQQDKMGLASNDDMSVDLMSEMEGDSNVEMGGMDDEKSNTGPDATTTADGAKPRKRRKKVEEYDKEDDFIDDTELAWQEQAAVAKDGFFVYSGPLVPEGQQPQVETSAPTRGSRGRGRGRGARSTGAGTTHASLADKSRDPAAPTTTTAPRARGTRGRGTGAPRKPRITKADKEKMDAEKADRERSAATTTTTAGSGVASSPPKQIPQPPSSAAILHSSPLASQAQPPPQPAQQAVGSMA